MAPGSNSIKGNGRATLMSLNDFIGIESKAFKIVTKEPNLKSGSSRYVSGLVA